MAPTLWITGETCGLGPLRRDLAELYWQWENELRVMVGNGRQTPESLDQRAEGLEHQMKRTDSQARFTIYDTTRPEPVPVGTCELVIQHRWRNAEFFILLGSGHRAKGIGTEATKLTLDYAFHITNLRNVYLTVLAPNTAGIKAYEKAGFRVIGTRRQSGYWLGQPCDEILMDAIKDDFPGPSTVRTMVGQDWLSRADRPDVYHEDCLANDASGRATLRHRLTSFRGLRPTRQRRSSRVCPGRPTGRSGPRRPPAIVAECHQDCPRRSYAELA